MARDEAILLDVVRAARLVVEFREGVDKTAFLDDLKTQSAILHHSPSIKSSCTGVAWEPRPLEVKNRSESGSHARFAVARENRAADGAFFDSLIS